MVSYLQYKYRMLFMTSYIEETTTSNIDIIISANAKPFTRASCKVFADVVVDDTVVSTARNAAVLAGTASIAAASSTSGFASADNIKYVDFITNSEVIGNVQANFGFSVRTDFQLKFVESFGISNKLDKGFDRDFGISHKLLLDSSEHTSEVKATAGITELETTVLVESYKLPTDPVHGRSDNLLQMLGKPSPIPILKLIGTSKPEVIVQTTLTPLSTEHTAVQSAVSANVESTISAALYKFFKLSDLTKKLSDYAKLTLSEVNYRKI